MFVFFPHLFFFLSSVVDVESFGSFESGGTAVVVDSPVAAGVVDVEGLLILLVYQSDTRFIFTNNRVVNVEQT